MVCLAVAAFPGNVRVLCPCIPVEGASTLQQLRDLLSLWSSIVSSSCDQSMGSSVVGIWVAMLALANKFDMMSVGCGNSSAGAKMPQNYSSISMENYTTGIPAMPKLILGSIWTDLGYHHGCQLLELALAAACHKGAALRSTSPLRPT